MPANKQQAFFIGGDFSMRAKLKRLLSDSKGEADYISTTIYILVGVVLLTFIISIVSLLSAKIQMDHAVDQITKQVQIAGGVNDDTNALIDFLAADISGIEHLQCNITTDDGNTSKIQLGTPFTVVITADKTLGGFWRVLPVTISITSKAAGVSEIYWK
jgi:hypothetical protein